MRLGLQDPALPTPHEMHCYFPRGSNGARAGCPHSLLCLQPVPRAPRPKAKGHPGAADSREEEVCSLASPTLLQQAWRPGSCWSREGRSQFPSQEQEGRGSAAEARMTELPAMGREGQWRQTTARQEGCTFFRLQVGAGRAWSNQRQSPQALICPGAGQLGSHSP